MFETFFLTGVLLLTRPLEKSLMASLHKDSPRTQSVQSSARSQPTDKKLTSHTKRCFKTINARVY